MDKALQVRGILATRGLTLYSLTRKSAELFGHSSLFRVPQSLYYDLARTTSKPTIYQVLALSHITDYRLSDWLAVFGFDLSAIPRFQLLIPRQQTTILDSTVYDTYAWIPWFAERPKSDPPPSIAPLGHFLTSAAPKRARDLVGPNNGKFFYARVGEQDLYALPYFAPGSVVRVDTRRREELPINPSTNGEGPFFLVEQDSGWICSRLILLAKDRVLLRCPQRPCKERELQIGRDARILGTIDAEIRPVTSRRLRHALSKSAAPHRPRLDPPGERPSLAGILRRSRMRVGLSFRDASSASRLIAETLADEQYFAAASTLSDYEAQSSPPRHIEKIITLCVLNSIGLYQFLRASGFPLGQAGREPIPDELIPRQIPSRNRGAWVADQGDVREPAGFLAALLNQWEDFPIFLTSSLDEITGLKGFSLSDVFWVGGDKTPWHPLLINAAFVVVNRRARKPSPPAEDSVCEEPLYLILSRNGGYLCGRCTLDEGNLVVHGYPGRAISSQQFRDGIDAEVIGRVTTILRRLL